MSDKEESQETTRSAAMAESEETQQQSQQEQEQSEISKKFEKMSISLSIWPPTQRTREAVINRLIETLSATSILSKRYGSLPLEEATTTARLIEKEAFDTANTTATATATATGAGTTAATAGAIEDDGVEILQSYSKEISKRMLDAVKAKAAAPSPADNAPQTTPVAVATETNEEISSVESETS